MTINFTQPVAEAIAQKQALRAKLKGPASGV